MAPITCTTADVHQPTVSTDGADEPNRLPIEVRMAVGATDEGLRGGFTNGPN